MHNYAQNCQKLTFSEDMHVTCHICDFWVYYSLKKEIFYIHLRPTIYNQLNELCTIKPQIVQNLLFLKKACHLLKVRIPRNLLTNFSLSNENAWYHT